MRLRVHMESLVLRGVRAVDSDAFASGLRDELQRRLGGQPDSVDVLTRRSRQDLRVTRIEVASNASGAQIGRQVAKAITGAGRDGE